MPFLHFRREPLRALRPLRLQLLLHLLSFANLVFKLCALCVKAFALAFRRVSLRSPRPLRLQLPLSF